jgi:hypothetical protein
MSSSCGDAAVQDSSSNQLGTVFGRSDIETKGSLANTLESGLQFGMATGDLKSIRTQHVALEIKVQLEVSTSNF